MANHSSTGIHLCADEIAPIVVGDGVGCEPVGPVAVVAVVVAAAGKWCQQRPAVDDEVGCCRCYCSSYCHGG